MSKMKKHMPMIRERLRRRLIGIPEVYTKLDYFGPKDSMDITMILKDEFNYRYGELTLKIRLYDEPLDPLPDDLES